MNISRDCSYLLDLIQKYSSSSNESLESFSIINLKKELEVWARDCFISFNEFGSLPRGTGLKSTANIKLSIFLKEFCFQKFNGIKTCYESLYTYLSENHRDVKKKNVSICLRLDGLNIDILPIFKLNDKSEDHLIFKNDTKSELVTNTLKHIEEIKFSGILNEILIFKIWCQQQKIFFPSIYLEFFLIEIFYKLNFVKSNSLSENFRYLLRKLSRKDANPLFLKVRDPSNRKNFLSDLIDDNYKNIIIKKSQKMMLFRDVKDIIF